MTFRKKNNQSNNPKIWSVQAKWEKEFSFSRAFIVAVTQVAFTADKLLFPVMASSVSPTHTHTHRHRHTHTHTHTHTTLQHVWDY